MASAVVVCNFKGDILIYRRYRDDIDRREIQNFCDNVIATRKAKAPAMLVAGSSFMHVSHNDCTFICATKVDANAMMLLHFIQQFITVLCSYFENGVVNDASLRSNFSLVYELLDEVCDYGYP